MSSHLSLSTIERLLRDDPESTSLARWKGDPRWSQKRRNAFQWIKKHLVDSTGHFNFSKLRADLSTRKSTDETHYTRRLMELYADDDTFVNSTLSHEDEYSPFRDFADVQSTLEHHIADGITANIHRRKEQLWTESEQANYKSKEELIRLLESWLIRHRSLLFEGIRQDTSVVSSDEILALRRVALLLCLNLLNGPCRRREYLRLQCQYDPSRSSYKQNYVVEETRDRNGTITQLCLGKYKSHKHYGDFTKYITDPTTSSLIDLITHSDSWRSEIARSSSEFRYHLFNQRVDPTVQIQRAFANLTNGDCQSLSVNLLRKIDVEHYYNKGNLYYPSGQRWLATQHGNSVKTQMEYYWRSSPRSVHSIYEPDTSPTISESESEHEEEIEDNDTTIEAEFIFSDANEDDNVSSDILISDDEPQHSQEDESSEVEIYSISSDEQTIHSDHSNENVSHSHDEVESDSVHNTSTNEDENKTAVNNDIPQSIRGITPLQYRALSSLGPELRHLKIKPWRKSIYSRMTLFEGQPIGQIIESIGGSSITDYQRVKKILHYISRMPSWRTEEQIEDVLARTRATAMEHKRRKL